MATERGEDFDMRRALELILSSATYRKAEDDLAFIKSPELRPLRLAMELMKAERVQELRGIRGTVVVFGGTRILEKEAAEQRLARAEAALAASPGDEGFQAAVRAGRRGIELSRYYDEARSFGSLVTKEGQGYGSRDFVIVTGGGPGVMEAANRGAMEAGGVSIGLNITLPFEQVPNPYITPDLCFQFHYFAIRKMHFLLRARAMVGFPGGFGTMDEVFETLTLIQTRTMQRIPIVLFGRDYWARIVDFEAFAEEGTIDRRDLDLIAYAETAEEAWKVIADFYEKADLSETWCPIHKP